jgi:hypothetical protein
LKLFFVSFTFLVKLVGDLGQFYLVLGILILFNPLFFGLEAGEDFLGGFGIVPEVRSFGGGLKLSYAANTGGDVKETSLAPQGAL